MAVTVTYEHPIAGVVAPTAQQMIGHDLCVANIIADADGDAAAVVTHNMAISVADLAAGLPSVVLEPGPNAAAQLSLWIVTAKDANTVTVGKTVVGGSGNVAAQLRVHVRRPHTIGR